MFAGRVQKYPGFSWDFTGVSIGYILPIDDVIGIATLGRARLFAWQAW